MKATWNGIHHVRNNYYPEERSGQRSLIMMHIKMYIVNRTSHVKKLRDHEIAPPLVQLRLGGTPR